MAKNKKRKKAQSAHPSLHAMVKKSNDYWKAHYVMAQRILRAIGEDASLFDVFTKRQKKDIFYVPLFPPRIAAASGHTVPRHYIRHIQERLSMFLRRNYFNEEEGITWMDISTVGLLMMSVFDDTSTIPSLLSEEQQKVKKRISEAFSKQGIVMEIYNKLMGWVRTTLIMISQPNFRIYGQEDGKYQTTSSGICFTVYIMTHESQMIRFKYHNTERKAYRIAIGQQIDLPYEGATIAMSKIYPNIERDRQLDIYMQSHALHRFKERIDTIAPIFRNEFFVISLMITQQVIHGADGTPLIACITPIDTNTSKTVGYFTFTIDRDKLLVLTLLPLLSQNVPEGRILYDRLHLSAEDLKYLGMDKLSFFYEVDIEQIPLLKKVLFDELHLEYVRTIYNSFWTQDEPFNEKKTLFVKNFFQKLEEYSTGSPEKILNKLATVEDVTPENDPENPLCEEKTTANS